jgi:hypothetical protein
MPYKIVKVKGGYKVQNMDTRKFYSTYPLSLEIAKKQILALLIHTRH